MQSNKPKYMDTRTFVQLNERQRAVIFDGAVEIETGHGHAAIMTNEEFLKVYEAVKERQGL